MRADFKERLEHEIVGFKDKFLAAATANFGSGWMWLVYDADADGLKIISTSSEQTPILSGLIPLLVVDTHAHDYYADKADYERYLTKFYENIDWDFVSASYAWAMREGFASIEHYIVEYAYGSGCSCGGKCGK